LLTGCRWRRRWCHWWCRWRGGARGAAGGGPYARAETWRSELGSTVEGARRPEVPGGECSEAREARRSGMPEGCQRCPKVRGARRPGVPEGECPKASAGVECPRGELERGVRRERRREYPEARPEGRVPKRD